MDSSSRGSREPSSAAAAQRPRQRVWSKGVMGDLFRSKDWSVTGLGPMDSWPSELVNVVNFLLESRFPVVVLWGKEQRFFLYNDGMVPLLAAGVHPSILGQPGHIAMRDMIETMTPILDSSARGETLWLNNLQFTFERAGHMTETYFTFSYSPLRNEDGDITGFIAPMVETTQQVLSERRMATLRDLGCQGSGAKTLQDAADMCSRIIVNTQDFTFAQVYLVNRTKQRIKLVSSQNLPIEHAAVISEVSLDRQHHHQSHSHCHLEGVNGSGNGNGNGNNKAPVFQWPLSEAITSRKPVVVEGIHEKFRCAFPGGSWPESSRTAVLLPLLMSGGDEGVLVVGLSPRIQSDEPLSVHLDLVAQQVVSAINSAKAYDAECTRAENLVKLDREKTTFFSNISHEFRTPLALIDSPLRMMLDDTHTPLADVQRQRALMVQRNSRRLLKLVNSLLDFNRAEARRMTATFVPVDLPSFTADLASTFRSTVEEGGLTFNVNIADDAIGEPVYVDKDMWEKIVYNLLSNAFKFTTQGSITIELTRNDLLLPSVSPSSSSASTITPATATAAVAGDHQLSAGSPTSFARLRIIDTGCGIPEAELPRLFERFHRVEGSRGRNYEGSGIGLTLTHELVKMHGGRIHVDSSIGKGTTFSVIVPLGTSHLPGDRVLVREDHDVEATSTAISQAYVEEAKQWLPETGTSASTTDGSLSSEQLTPRSSVDDNNFDWTSAIAAKWPSSGDDHGAPSKYDAAADVDEEDSNVLTTMTGNEDIMIEWLSDNTPVMKRASYLSIKEAPHHFGLPNATLLLAEAVQRRHNKPLVLVVDDNRDMLHYLQSILATRYRVLTANNGQEALDVLDRLKASLDKDNAEGLPCAIVSDGMMPYVNGVELIARVHAKPAIRHIPVLLLSARASEEAHVEGLQAGADDYLAKPFSARELLARVQTQAQVGMFRLQLERVVAERTRALAESEKQYRLLTQMSPVCIYRRDHLGRMTFANMRFVEKLGLQGLGVDDLVNWTKIVHPEDDYQTAHSIAMSVAGTPISMDGRLVRPLDGKVIWMFKQSMNDVDHLTGQLVGTVSVISDISEMKMLQSDRLVALQNAEQEAYQRAIDAEEHRRQKELFIDMVCHEIRNPLNGIVNSVEILQTNSAKRDAILQAMDLSPTRDSLLAISSDDNSFLSSVAVCMLYQKKITDDVLKLSHVPSGTVLLAPEPLCPTDLVRSICDMFSGTSRRDDVRLLFLPPDSSSPKLWVCADPHHLSQIIATLLSNAFKSTINSSSLRQVQVLVACERVDDSDSALLRLIVRDTGAGMTANELANLKERLGQPNLKTYNRYYDGLDLVIVKMLLDLMHGELVIESTHMQGSSFTVTIPCNIVPAPPQSSPTPPPPEPAAPTRADPVVPIRILVVEDNDINQRLLKRQLESSLACTATLADNGLAALELVQREHFDVILMDIEMPVMDGLEATRRIRHLESTVPLGQQPHVPIIGLSGNARDVHVKAGLSAGMDLYIAKPYVKDYLIQSIISKALRPSAAQF